MTAEFKLIPVAPQDGRPRLDHRLAQHVVKIHNLVAGLVADDDEHGPVAVLDAVLDERPDPFVHLLPHRRSFPLLMLILPGILSAGRANESGLLAQKAVLGFNQPAGLGF